MNVYFHILHFSPNIMSPQCCSRALLRCLIVAPSHTGYLNKKISSSATFQVLLQPHVASGDPANTEHRTFLSSQKFYLTRLALTLSSRWLCWAKWEPSALFSRVPTPLTCLQTAPTLLLVPEGGVPTCARGAVWGTWPSATLRSERPQTSQQARLHYSRTYSHSYDYGTTKPDCREW